MWLSVEQKRQPRQYAFVNGFKNVAWITGYVQRIGEGCFFLSQTGSPDTVIPIFIETSSHRPPPETQQAVSVICRVGGVHDLGCAMPLLTAMGFDRPSVINLAPRDIYRVALGDMPDAEPGNPSTPLRTSKPNPASNVVHLSGLLEHIEHLPSSHNPGLQLLIRQHPQEGSAIPVRIYGRHQAQYRKRLRIGMPVFVEGVARARVESRQGQLTPFIQTTDVRVPQRGKDILSVPDWAYRFMSDHAPDPELKRYIGQMRVHEGQGTSGNDTPSVIDDL